MARYTGKIIPNVSIDGALFPVVGEVLYLITIGKNQSVFLPMFSSEDKLREYMRLPRTQESLSKYGTTYYKIKKVEDQFDFLASLTENAIRIMLDPVEIATDRHRWTTVVWDRDIESN